MTVTPSQHYSWIYEFLICTVHLTYYSQSWCAFKLSITTLPSQKPKRQIRVNAQLWGKCPPGFQSSHTILHPLLTQHFFQACDPSIVPSIWSSRPSPFHTNSQLTLAGIQQVATEWRMNYFLQLLPKKNYGNSRPMQYNWTKASFFS